jgi:hypothetical protein
MAGKRRTTICDQSPILCDGRKLPLAANGMGVAEVWAFCERSAMVKVIKPNRKTNVQPMFVRPHGVKPMLCVRAEL